MRVTVLHHHWVHYKDILFSELNKTVDDLEVVFISPFHEAGKFSRDLTNVAYRLVVLSPRPYSTPWRFDVVYPLFRYLVTRKPSVLVVCGWANTSFWLSALWGKMTGVTCILWAESNEFDHPRTWLKEFIKKQFLRLFDGAHVYGTSNREYLIRLGMAPDRIRIKRATLDLTLFKLERKPGSYAPDGVVRFLYVGRLEEYKNIRLLLDAFESVCADMRSKQVPVPTLTIVGFGPLQQFVEDRIGGSVFGSQMRFMGPVAQRDLPGVYGTHDVFILPSQSEPWGLVANEAMSCGLPVVLSDRCGCASDLVRPETGWVFRPDSVESLRCVLLRVMDVPSERLESMGIAANLLSAEYGADATAHRVSSFLVETYESDRNGKGRSDEH